MVAGKEKEMEMTRRSESTMRSGEKDESGTSIDYEKKVQRTSDTDNDEGKATDLHHTLTRDSEKITSADHPEPLSSPRTKSLRLTKSHRSYGGEDGYSCFQEDDSDPNNAGDAADEPFLVTWDGGDADPLNPRSMTNARRWAITLIVSASSLCV
jgi:hypothetical protein